MGDREDEQEGLRQLDPRLVLSGKLMRIYIYIYIYIYTHVYIYIYIYYNILIITYSTTTSNNNQQEKEDPLSSLQRSGEWSSKRYWSAVKSASWR